MPRTKLIASVAFLLSPTALTAQELPLLQPGARVRVTAPALGMTRAAGTVQAVRGDTLVMLSQRGVTIQIDKGHPQPVTETVYVPLGAVTALDLHRGRRSNFLLGAGIGGLVGMVMGFASGDDPEDQWFAFSASEKAAMLGGTLALVGGLVGLAAKTDRWEPVPVDRLRIRPMAYRGKRVGFVVSLSF